MPYVNIQITKGATREQKAQLVRDITDSLVRVLGKKPEHTHIVIQEIEDEDWGFSGLLTDEWNKQQRSNVSETKPNMCLAADPTPLPHSGGSATQFQH
ncbi:4-oxalocrotonate tautomerase family protein [Iningainema tapete]|uniref:tautomerase family protein n=1 Tax=Iningainema tapete TaxID=2806730 RepID=UPI0030807E34